MNQVSILKHIKPNSSNEPPKGERLNYEDSLQHGLSVCGPPGHAMPMKMKHVAALEPGPSRQDPITESGQIGPKCVD
ncbi:hypothetical protein JTE90_021280 [Oedothorax gibbosus]|uniref:Uncharacterized protein n=1 Tax=Oedothorax gibbosus TaxID=931172 RepID=A0AAV6U6A4_9ARAC|nr:hypothetical protein JTE90_021280 [Oedothorax gibbosus]